jgi:hypothetical protein
VALLDPSVFWSSRAFVTLYAGQMRLHSLLHLVRTMRGCWFWLPGSRLPDKRRAEPGDRCSQSRRRRVGMQCVFVVKTSGESQLVNYGNNYTCVLRK